MNRKEVSEIKRQLKPERSTISRMCGCYVDGDKNKKTEISGSFLTRGEEECFKYFAIFKKTLSGGIGKNLVNMEFSEGNDKEGGTQEMLLKLRDSELKDEALVENFYDKVIKTYEYGENYYIILAYGSYDVPLVTSDGIENEDASDNVYSFIICSICPVNLTDAGLCYNAGSNTIETRMRDWLVDMPAHGFLYPAFNDRTADVHQLLYYTKNSELMQETFVGEALGLMRPLTYKTQKSTFSDIVENTLGRDCVFDTVKSIHENLNTYVEETLDAPQPPVLDKQDVKHLLSNSGVKASDIEKNFDEAFDTIAGEVEKPVFSAGSVASRTSFDIKMPDVSVKVKPERTDLVQVKNIDGVNYIMIEINDRVEVNGINIRMFDTETGEIYEEE